MRKRYYILRAETALDSSERERECADAFAIFCSAARLRARFHAVIRSGGGTSGEYVLVQGDFFYVRVSCGRLLYSNSHCSGTLDE